MTSQWKYKWRPLNCQTRYADRYVFDCERDTGTPEPSEAEPSPPPTPAEPVPPNPWCPACMRRSFDPITLNCGHSFCRRCLAGVNPYLMQDHWPTIIADQRVELHCPVGDCKETLLCLPFVNGDFRFKEIRPTDKMPDPIGGELMSAPANRKAKEELKTYKVRVDIDLSRGRNDTLVKAIPFKVINKHRQPTWPESREDAYMYM